MVLDFILFFHLPSASHGLYVFAMGETCGIHFIWTTYGTWLPGDPSKPGHWSPLFDLYGRVRSQGGQLQLPDDETFHVVQQKMTESPVNLCNDAQHIVANVVYETMDDCGCVHALATESKHVHVLTGALNQDVKVIAGRIKGRSSSEILKLPEYWGRTRVWTKGYWKVFLFNNDAVCAVQNYVQNHNLRRGLSANPYDWIQPI